MAEVQHNLSESIREGGDEDREVDLSNNIANMPPIKPPSQGSILLKLFFHSIAMFSFPFGAYYFTKQYVEDEYNIPAPRSYIYGAIAAVVIVHVIIVSYVYQAFREEEKFKEAKEFERKIQ